MKELSTQRLPCFHLCSARRLAKLKLLFLHQLSHKFGHRVISQAARMGKSGRDHSGSGSASSWSSRVIPEQRAQDCPDGSGLSPLRRPRTLPGKPLPVRGHLSDESFSNTCGLLAALCFTDRIKHQRTFFFLFF